MMLSSRSRCCRHYRSCCRHCHGFFVIVDVSIICVSTFISFIVVHIAIVGTVVGFDGFVGVFVVGMAVFDVVVVVDVA